MKCECQDSAGHVCGKEMSKKEYRQDGMCQNCADNVWNEMTSTDHPEWFHESSLKTN